MAPPSLRCRRSGRAPPHHEVAAVVTRADRAGSRGRPAPRPVADAARDLGLELLTPATDRRARGGAQTCSRCAPDCLVVAAYGQILPAGADRPAAARCGQRPRIAAAALAWRITDRARDPRRRCGDRRLDHAHGGGSRHRAGLLDGARPDRRPMRRRRRSPPSSPTWVRGSWSRCSTALERGTAVATPQPEEGVTYAPRLTRVGRRGRLGRALARSRSIGWCVRSSRGPACSRRSTASTSRSRRAASPRSIADAAAGAIVAPRG